MQSLGGGKHTLALLLFACVLLAEVQGSLAKKESEPMTKKGSKIRRIVRVVEPPSAVIEKPANVSPHNVELQKEGLSNKVEVNPTISIGAPLAAPTVSELEKKEDDEPSSQDASQLQLVPYKPEEVVAAAPQVPAVDSHLKQLLVSDSSHNQAHVAQQNSGNQLVNLGANNNNVLSKVLSNSGNTEQVHIDGVGNNKITRITNVGNTEEQQLQNVSNQQQQQQAVVQQVASNQLPVQQAAALPLGPLVQISMNNEKQPQQLGNLPYAAWQVANWPLQMVQPNVQQLATFQPQNPLMFQQPMMPSMVPSMVPSMMQPMMISTMVTPHQWRSLMRPRRQRHHQHHHHHHHHHHCPHQNKKSKRDNKKKSKEEGEEKNSEPKPVQQKEEKPQEEVVVIPPLPAEKTPIKTVVQLVKPEEEKERAPVLLKQVSLPKPEEKRPVLVAHPEEAEDNDEEEEVIEWETVRVPKTRKVLKSRKN